MSGSTYALPLGRPESHTTTTFSPGCSAAAFAIIWSSRSTCFSKNRTCKAIRAEGDENDAIGTPLSPRRLISLVATSGRRYAGTPRLLSSATIDLAHVDFPPLGAPAIAIKVASTLVRVTMSRSDKAAL